MAPLSPLTQGLDHFLVERLVEPTATTVQAASRVVLARQATTTIVTGTVVATETTVLSGGAIAGIVIGSIVGFLLICWIIRACMNWGRPDTWGTTFEPAHEKTRSRSRRGDTYYHHETHGPRRSHSRHSHHSHHSHHRSPRRSTEVRDVYYSRQVTPQRVPSRGRSPQAPPAVYQVRPETTARESRRKSRSTRY